MCMRVQAGGPSMARELYPACSTSAIALALYAFQRLDPATLCKFTKNERRLAEYSRRFNFFHHTSIENSTFDACEAGRKSSFLL